MGKMSELDIEISNELDELDYYLNQLERMVLADMVCNLLEQQARLDLTTANIRKHKKMARLMASGQYPIVKTTVRR